MTIDYNYEQIFSVSPKTQITYMEYSLTTDKPMMKKQQKSQDIIEKLHNYKFPKSTYQTPVTTCEDYHRVANIAYRRKSSFAATTATKLNRRFSHRRSAAVSASSNESIFSEAGTPLSSSPSTRTTHISSVNSDQVPIMSPISGCKLEFDEPIMHKESIPVQPPKKPTLAPTTEIPQYPIIDLDIAGKPLKPRSLGSPLHFPKDETVLNCTPKEQAEEQYQEDSEEDSISIVDFLRESMSERAMSVSVDYDPFQYVFLNQEMKITQSNT